MSKLKTELRTVHLLSEKGTKAVSGAGPFQKSAIFVQ